MVAVDLAAKPSTSSCPGPVPPAPGLTIVSGPSRSGKSRWAEHLAATSGSPVVYVATGPRQSSDSNWAARLEHHRRRRPTDWTCVEVEADLCDFLERQLPQSDVAPALVGSMPPVLLIDSLGTWIAHHLDLSEGDWLRLCERLSNSLSAQPGPVILVAEEAGWGVVPSTAIGCCFRDRLGLLQQCLTRQASSAWLVVAGRAINLIELGLAVPNP